MQNTSQKNLMCPICSTTMGTRVCDWTYYCHDCDYWASSLEPDVESINDPIFGDENSASLSFLNDIRSENFSTMLDIAIRASGEPAPAVLDIGCASGLFMKMAEQRGCQVTGLEPNPVMAAIAKQSGLNVIKGYFPDAIPQGAKYDLIVMNDVFEHLPNVSDVLLSCKPLLKKNAVFVINLPNSGGVLFKVARLLAHFGVLNPWDRLWQKMFYTPHLHYFNHGSLRKLLTKHGYGTVSDPLFLDSITLRGLWRRISIDRSTSVIYRSSLYLVIASLYPIIRSCPKDALCVFYRPT